MAGPGQGDPALLRFHPGVDGGGAAGRLGGLEQQFEVAQDGHRVLALQYRVRPQRGPDPAHRGGRAGRGAGPGTGAVAGDRADGQPDGAVRQRDRVVPVAAAGAVESGRDEPGGQPEPGGLREAVGQQAAAQGLGGAPDLLRVQLLGQQRRGDLGVPAGQFAAAVGGVGGAVVEPQGGGQRAVLLGGERQAVAPAEAELPGEFAQPGADRRVLGEVVRPHLGGPVVLAQQPGEQALVGRDGLQRAEAGAVQAEPERLARAAAGQHGDQQGAVGAEQRGAGGEDGVQGGAEAPGAGEPLGVLVQAGEIGQSSGQTVLRAGRRRGRAVGSGVGSAGGRGGAVLGAAVRALGPSGGRLARAGGRGRGRAVEARRVEDGEPAGAAGLGRLGGRRRWGGLGHAATPDAVVRVTRIMRNPPGTAVLERARPKGRVSPRFATTRH